MLVTAGAGGRPGGNGAAIGDASPDGELFPVVAAWSG